MKLKLTKRHLLWVTELFVWLLILFSIAGIITFARHTYKKNFNTYQIFLPDVDGLITGSPVRYMGIQVGYVSGINIVGEEVYIKFVVTQKNFKIPKGSMTTVEFTGLGGSKSLEIYPPKTPDKYHTDKILIPQTPKRISESLGVLNDMFDKIIKITYDISSFMHEVGIIKKNSPNNHTINKNSVEKLLDSADTWLDEQEEKKNRLE